MGEFKRKINEELKLKLSLSDGRTDKYVRAYFRDKAGAVILGDFVNLTHLGLGAYGNNAVQMPSLDQVHVIYRVFSDALYTALDQNYTQGLDVFELDTLDPTAFQRSPSAVQGTIKAGRVQSVVFERERIRGAIKAVKIAARIEQKAEIKGNIYQNQEIEGVVYE
jgi:hypothetical protein